MKKMETPDKKNLSRIIEEIRNGNYVIPDFQREFEWNAPQVVDLLQSILKDYYIGTLLLWKADRKNVEQLASESIYGFEGKSDPQHIILDGQQRLSALHYALFAPNKSFPKRKNRYFFFLKIDAFLENDIENAIFYKDSTIKVVELIEHREIQYEEKIMPLSVLSDIEFDSRDWIDGFKDYWIENGDENAKDIHTKLKGELRDLVNDYEISHIELDKEIPIDKVCDIFTKINSTGTKLDIFDLLNAILKPKDIQLKQMWRDVEGDFENIIEAKNILTIMSIIKQTYCAPSFLYFLVPNAVKIVKDKDDTKKESILIKDNDEFITLWNNVVKNEKKALSIIQNPRDYGAINKVFMPYITIMPIFTVLYMEKENDKYEDRHKIEQKIQQWYWSSVIVKNYSSAASSQMSKDYQEMLKWFESDEKEPVVIGQAKREIKTLQLINETSSSSALYRSVLNMIIIGGATDWVSAMKPEYSNLDDHHIVPASWGKKNLSNKKIDSILNKTVISDDTNRRIISDKLPNVYLKEMRDNINNDEKFYSILESHLISKEAVSILLRESFTKGDYDEFILERGKTVLYELRKKIGDVSITEQKLTESPNEALNAFEISMRDFIDGKLKKAKGNGYWRQNIPGDVKNKIKQKISRGKSVSPVEKMETNRQRLDYCDVSDYGKIILQNWNIFSGYFVTKEKLGIHLSNIREYRNMEKHVRKKDGSVQKLGEGSMEWIMNIISLQKKHNH